LVVSFRLEGNVMSEPSSARKKYRTELNVLVRFPSLDVKEKMQEAAKIHGITQNNFVLMCVMKELKARGYLDKK